MRTKEKLERAGWLYLGRWDEDKELYGRGKFRVIYDPQNREATHYFHTKEKHLVVLDDFMFEYLTEKP